MVHYRQKKERRKQHNELDRDAVKYRETCEKRKEAGKKGGRPAKETAEKQNKQLVFEKANGFSEKQTKAKKADTDTVTDTENETENDYETVTDTENENVTETGNDSFILSIPPKSPQGEGREGQKISPQGGVNREEIRDKREEKKKGRLAVPT